MADKLAYKVSIHGCDDSTHMTIDLTADEAALIERLAALSEKESTYQCMPTMTIEKHDIALAA